MTTTTKMTYVKALELAIACESLPSDVREKLEALKEQQVKRNSADKKPTAKQVENEALKAHVVEVLKGLEKPVTISELMTIDETLSTMSNQKVSALVRQLVEDGKVIRSEDKRKAYFKVA